MYLSGVDPSALVNLDHGVPDSLILSTYAACLRQPPLDQRPAKTGIQILCFV